MDGVIILLGWLLTALAVCLAALAGGLALLFVYGLVKAVRYALSRCL